MISSPAQMVAVYQMSCDVTTVLTALTDLMKTTVLLSCEALMIPIQYMTLPWLIELLVVLRSISRSILTTWETLTWWRWFTQWGSLSFWPGLILEWGFSTWRTSALVSTTSTFMTWMKSGYHDWSSTMPNRKQDLCWMSSLRWWSSTQRDQCPTRPTTSLRMKSFKALETLFRTGETMILSFTVTLI